MYRTLVLQVFWKIKGRCCYEWPELFIISSGEIHNQKVCLGLFKRDIQYYLRQQCSNSLDKLISCTPITFKSLKEPFILPFSPLRPSDLFVVFFVFFSKISNNLQVIRFHGYFSCVILYEMKALLDKIIPSSMKKKNPSLGFWDILSRFSSYSLVAPSQSPADVIFPDLLKLKCLKLQWLIILSLIYDHQTFHLHIDF